MPRWPRGRRARSLGVGHLARLDEPHPRGAVGGREQPQKHSPSRSRRDDLLLPLVPVVQADEIVEHGLHGRGKFRRAARGRLPFLDRGPIRVPGADDVADAVFVAVDGELVGDRQQPALVADLAKLHLGRRPPAADCDAIQPAAQWQPRHTVAIEDRIERIDDRRAKLFVSFLEPLFEAR